MKRRYAAVVTTLLLACGCRTTETLDGGHAVTGTGVMHPTDSFISHDRPTQTQTTGAEPPPEADRRHIRPVAFQEPPSPLGQSKAEPLPMPPAGQTAMAGSSLADFENVALSNNPALAQAAARVDAARGNWIQVGLPPNPQIGYSGQEIGGEGSAGQQGGFFGQQLITGSKLRLNRQTAAWEIQRAQQELEATRLRVLTDVRITYYDVLIAQRREELASELVDISQRGLQAAQALFRGEEVSEADPLRATVEADTARILLQTSTNQRLEAWRRLAAIIGTPELPPERLDGDLTLGNLDLSWQDTLQQVLRESPEIAAALADVEAAQWAVERAYAQVVPNVNLQAGVAHNDANGDTLTSVNVSVPLPIINRNQGGIRRAQAQAAAAQQAVDRLALDLQTRLATVFQRYQTARNQVEKYSRPGGILENAERTLQLIRAGYQAEEFGVLDLLAAQRTFFQTNLAYLDSLRQLWAAAMEIRGLLLQGSLSK